MRSPNYSDQPPLKCWRCAKREKEIKRENKKIYSTILSDWNVQDCWCFVFLSFLLFSLFLSFSLFFSLFSLFLSFTIVAINSKRGGLNNHIPTVFERWLICISGWAHQINLVRCVFDSEREKKREKERRREKKREKEKREKNKTPAILDISVG